VKTLARRNAVKGIGCHIFEYNRPVVQRDFRFNEGDAFLLHFSSRGIFDIVNKIQYGRLNNIKTEASPASALDKLLKQRRRGRLPSRLLSLALQSRLENYRVDCVCDTRNRKYGTDVELLKEITLGGLQSLLGRKVVESEMLTVISKVEDQKIPHRVIALYGEGRVTIMEAINEIEYGFFSPFVKRWKKWRSNWPSPGK
jgi:hypothetical protein